MTIAINFKRLQTEVTRLCNKLNINNSVTIVAVSKTFPSNDIIELHQQTGQSDFAENYVQELVQKAETLKKHNLTWHFIGHIQRNKTRQIAQLSHWVHSIENKNQILRLNKDRPSDMPKLNLLIEVNLSNAPQRHGVTSLDNICELANLINSQKNLLFRGLMGIASNSQDKSIINAQFKHLRNLFDALSIRGFKPDTLSMGMSGDYVTAIENSTTMIRIGSAIFGSRNNNSNASHNV